MVADLKIEGDDVRYFLPTFVAPRYTPRTESDPIPSGNVRRVLQGLQLRARCDMTDNITAITSPSHQITYDPHVSPLNRPIQSQSALYSAASRSFFVFCAAQLTGCVMRMQGAECGRQQGRDC